MKSICDLLGPNQVQMRFLHRNVRFCLINLNPGHGMQKTLCEHVDVHKLIVLYQDLRNKKEFVIKSRNVMQK